MPTAGRRDMCRTMHADALRPADHLDPPRDERLRVEPDLGVPAATVHHVAAQQHIVTVARANRTQTTTFVGVAQHPGQRRIHVTRYGRPLLGVDAE